MLSNTNNSIQHYSFVCTQLNVFQLSKWFSISNRLQVQSLWVKVDLRVIAMKRYSTFPNLQIWSLTIRCSLMSYLEQHFISINHHLRLVGWLVVMWMLRLFHTQISLIIMIFYYRRCKIDIFNHFKYVNTLLSRSALRWVPVA